VLLGQAKVETVAAALLSAPLRQLAYEMAVKTQADQLATEPLAVPPVIAATAVPALVTKFAWIAYVFGVFLILSGIKTFVKREEEIHPRAQPDGGFVQAAHAGDAGLSRDRFFVRENGIRRAAPLFVVLLLVEVHRPDLGRGFHSGDLRRDERTVYRLHVERVCHPWPALAVFRFRWGDGQIPLPEDRARGGVVVRRGEDEAARKIDTLVSLGVIVLVLTVSVVWLLLRPKRRQPAALATSPIPKV
jgi:hypothetical protein